MDGETKVIINPAVALKELMWGYRVSQAMYVMTKIGCQGVITCRIWQHHCQPFGDMPVLFQLCSQTVRKSATG